MANADCHAMDYLQGSEGSMVSGGTVSTAASRVLRSHRTLHHAGVGVCGYCARLVSSRLGSCCRAGTVYLLAKGTNCSI